MLDENLPTFFLNAARQSSSIQMCQHGSDPEPVYSLRYPDPALPASKNCYAAALYDSYNPGILFGEVLLNPHWTQPTLSQEAIRLNNGVAPPPEPLLPTEFTIQLYNPDQQVLVRYKPKSWNSPASWHFEMPQQTFRQPSNSSIDRTLNDPSASDATPKLRFNWHKDGKLSKDLSCFLSGKTVNADGSKKKNKEPDITLAILQNLKEITLYEPNLYRVEMEDFKGLEVVLMLGAVVIRDVYFSQIREAFNVSDSQRQRSSSTPAPGRNNIPPTLVAVPPSHSTGKVPQKGNSPVTPTSNSRPSNARPQKPQGSAPPQRQTGQQGPPPTDPRSQWEIDAESARLKQKTQAEEKERKKREQEEEKRTKKLLEAEQKATRKKQAEIEKETERLKKLYGNEQQQYFSQNAARPQLPPRGSDNPRPSRQSYSHQPAPHPSHQRASSTAYPQRQWQGPYLHVPGQQYAQASSPQIAQPRPASSMAMLGPNSAPQVKEKKSFFSFSKPKDEGAKLGKKKSSMF